VRNYLITRNHVTENIYLQPPPFKCQISQTFEF